MSDDEPEAVAEPLERPSWEALTDAFVPGSTPEVRIIEVDSQHNIIQRVTLIVDVAGREAYVECIVRSAHYARRRLATGSQEEQRARSRSPRRDTTQEEPPPAAAAAAEAVQQPGSSRDAQNDGLDWELEESCPRDM